MHMPTTRACLYWESACVSELVRAFICTYVRACVCMCVCTQQALASLQYLNGDLWGLLLRDARAKLSAFTGTQLTDMIRALATARLKPSTQWQTAFVDASLKHLKGKKQTCVCCDADMKCRVSAWARGTLVQCTSGTCAVLLVCYVVNDCIARSEVAYARMIVSCALQLQT